MSDSRTFPEIKREVEVVLAEYERSLLAYLEWVEGWRDRNGGFRCKRGENALPEGA